MLSKVIPSSIYYYLHFRLLLSIALGPNTKIKKTIKLFRLKKNKLNYLLLLLIVLIKIFHNNIIPIR